MTYNRLKQFCAVFVAFLILSFIIHAFLQSSEAAKAYQYRVISIGGMTEIRTESNTQGGRMATLEKIVNDQAAAGWEFVQAEGYILYFRK